MVARAAWLAALGTLVGCGDGGRGAGHGADLVAAGKGVSAEALSDGGVYSWGNGDSSPKGCVGEGSAPMRSAPAHGRSLRTR